MKKFVLISLLTLFGIGTCCGQLVPKIDERIELTGVIFRLAGIPEYTDGRFESYNADIDDYFTDYRFGNLTAYLVKLRNEDRLGYSAVAGSAMFLTIENGHVIPNPDLSLSELPGLGQQWKDEDTFRTYVKMLDEFYRKSRFRKFFEDHREMYETAKAAVNELFKGFNGAWFADFFGEELKYPSVYVALGYGSSNYYIMDYESDAGYAIVIGAEPRYMRDYTFPVIIHEICHHYSNPLFYRNWPRMEQAGETIYEEVKEAMARNAYGSARESMLEWQNNLFTAMYLKENEFYYEPFWTAGLRDRGFIWLPRSVAFMDNFYDDRDDYPHIDSFMPQLAGFLNSTAREFDKVKFEFRNKPYVVGVFPPNGCSIPEEGFDEIKIRFSVPMSTQSFGISIIEDDESIQRMPRSDSIDAYWKDSCTFVIPIEKSRLEKNKTYGIVLKKAFMTDEYNKLEDEYKIIYYPQSAHP